MRRLALLLVLASLAGCLPRSLRHGLPPHPGRLPKPPVPHGLPKPPLPHGVPVPPVVAPLPVPVPGPAPVPVPRHEPQPEKPHNPYAHLPQRTSFTTKADTQLKEGCYVGDFVLGRSQIDVSGVGVGKTVIQGNLILKTQCTVSNVTVTGNVIFEGHQAKLIDSDFFGEIIDKGSQNKY